MLYVRKKRDYFTKKGKQTNDEETMEKQAILFPARDRKKKCKLETYLNYVNTWNTNKLYAVLLTNGRF